MAKRLLFDFQCGACDHRFESLVTPDTKVKVCSECGSEARRLITGTHLDYRMGVDTNNTTMAAKWDKMHKQEMEKQAKREEG